MDPTHDAPNILAQLLEPLEECMTPEVAERIAALRASPQAQARIDELADKCTEGELTSEERAEYESYVHAIKMIGVLQAQARDVLTSARLK